MIEDNIREIKEIIFRERKITSEINSLMVYHKNADAEEKTMVNQQVEQLKAHLRRENDKLLELLEKASINRPLVEKEEPVKIKEEYKYQAGKEYLPGKEEKLSEFEKETIKRLKKGKEKVAEKKEKKPSQYLKMANNLFGEAIKSMVKQKRFASLEKDLIKSNLGYTSVAYLSLIILSVIISAGAAILIAVFFLFFNLSPDLPILIRATEPILERLLKVFWLPIVIPIATLIFMYVYPSLERKTLEGKISQELPFATIHMAAIAGSLIEPTKIFRIISLTKEYPSLEKEFNKLLNEINIYGYDIVTALKDCASNSPSAKLAELFNGLATTITSGGDLYDFFEKRSQTMLFEYRLDKEKKTKTAETFMDIYISVVIAAPMILMLLLMMMRISGLGGLSTSLITFLIVGGVSVINIFFLVFLQLKQPTAA